MSRGDVSRRHLWCFAVLATAVLGGTHAIAQTPEAIEQVCTICHRDKFEALAVNPHSALETEAWQERLGEGATCGACHGDVSEHVAAGGGLGNVFAFRDEAPLAQSERCLGCHSDSHPQFDSSSHATAGMTCVDCHSNHSPAPGSGLLKAHADAAMELGSATAASALCTDCHGDVFTQFAFNERHRVHEGTLECTSCHDPHASEQRALLGGFKQEQCVQCHADKGGPFVFEHAASRVEGCTACHASHGSPNRHMLTHQRVAELCYSCHAGVPQFHLGFNPAAPPRFDLDTQCTNCHSTIHGSHFDPNFLK